MCRYAAHKRDHTTKQYRNRAQLTYANNTYQPHAQIPHSTRNTWLESEHPTTAGTRDRNADTWPHPQRVIRSVNLVMQQMGDNVVSEAIGNVGDDETKSPGDCDVIQDGHTRIRRRRRRRWFGSALVPQIAIQTSGKPLPALFMARYSWQ